MMSRLTAAVLASAIGFMVVSCEAQESVELRATSDAECQQKGRSVYERAPQGANHPTGMMKAAFSAQYYPVNKACIVTVYYR